MRLPTIRRGRARGWCLRSIPIAPHSAAPAMSPFTEQVMLACRNAIGERCVFDNHDLDSNLASPLVPLYAYMRQLGPEIEFQTQFATPADFPATIRLGVQQGASSIELYQD